jgi:hypothetical protein
MGGRICAEGLSKWDWFGLQLRGSSNHHVHMHVDCYVAETWPQKTGADTDWLAGNTKELPSCYGLNTQWPSQGHALKSGSPGGTIWGGGGYLRRWDLVGRSGPQGSLPLKDPSCVFFLLLLLFFIHMCIQLPVSLFPGCHEVNGSVQLCSVCHDAVPHPSPETMESVYHGPKPLSQWAH